MKTSKTLLIIAGYFIFTLAFTGLALSAQSDLQGKWVISVDDTVAEVIKDMNQQLPPEDLATLKEELRNELANFALYFDIKKMTLNVTISGQSQEDSISITGTGNTFVVKDSTGVEVNLILKNNKLHFFTDDMTIILKKP